MPTELHPTIDAAIPATEPPVTVAQRSREKQAGAYRQFAADVAGHLTYVFTVEGHPRGTAKEARAVLRTIRDDLQFLRRTVEAAIEAPGVTQ